jgi:rhomboid protease GluP
MYEVNQSFDEDEFKSRKDEPQLPELSPEEEQKLRQKQNKNKPFPLAPKYEEELMAENFSAQQSLVIALEAAKKLGWKISYTSASGFIAFTRLTGTSWAEKVEVRVSGAAISIRSQCIGSQLFDWGKNKRNVNALIEAIQLQQSAFTSEELTEKYDELKPGLAAPQEDILALPPAKTESHGRNFLAIFTPVEGYFVTPILIDLNIAVFLLMVLFGVNFLAPDTQSLLKWGANFRAVTLAGQCWRLLTCCFIHIGIFHLLMNMYALLYIGFLLEPHLGRARFLSAYLLTGIAASVTSLWWHEFIVNAGASGAIFGMYGVFLALLMSNLFEKTEGRALLTSIGVFVIYNLANGMSPGIDNAAHAGGLISGILIGIAFIPGLKKPDASLTPAVIGTLSLLTFAFAYFMYTRLPNDLVTYDNQIKKFTAMESAAVGILKLPSNTNKSVRLHVLQSAGIDNWIASKQLISQLDTLHLPPVIHHKDKLLIDYCDLRIKSYSMMYKAISENSDVYNDSIRDYNKQILSLLDSLKVPRSRH